MNVQYQDECGLSEIMELIGNELSEPYSIFTYRYFLATWPNLCFVARLNGQAVGTIVAKLDVHRGKALRGYIAMLTVVQSARSWGVGTMLVKKVIEEMIVSGAEEVALEAEVTNCGALKLYEKLGFLRDKRLKRYYLNGSDAYRLRLVLPGAEERRAARELSALHLNVT